MFNLPLLGLVATASCLSMQANPTPPVPTPPPAASVAPEFPAEWFWNLEGSLAKHRTMVGKPPPPLGVTGWVGDAVTLESLRAERKVVVVEFWATWCGPCVQSLPKLAALAAAHPKDLAIVGVHDSKRGSDRMAEVARKAGVTYPLAIDDDRKSEKAWNVSFWPTIAVIDRTGTLRAIGLKPEHVGDAVARLLAE
jgi:thiol-disulfide isomerase/thioredoxin